MTKTDPPDIAHDRRLIGKPDSRWQINTPALVLDLDLVDKNIATMASHAAAAGINLRPHGKTHKSVELARRQISAGAIGLCTARLGEAEVFAQQGIGNILITAPLVSPMAIARAIDLIRHGHDLKLVADHPGPIGALAQAAGQAGMVVQILIDLDIGLHRTGISPDQHAIDLAHLIAGYPGLKLVGLQAYAGHLMHIADGNERREKSLDALRPVGQLAAKLRETGFDIGIVTGGGTGTFDIDATAGIFTELQVGSYLFMDVEYLAITRPNETPWPFQPGLFVQTCVISTNAQGFVTTDAGFKAFATDGPMPMVHAGAPAGSRYRHMGDEQGALILPEHAMPPAIGSIITCTLPHCDPTVNLYDFYHVVRGDQLIDLWPIDGRGRGR